MAESAPRRTRVKVCGITRESDALCAMACGADALGLVRVPASARHVTLQRAAQLRSVVTGFVHCVVLFLDPTEAEVHAAIEALEPDFLQFHGRESAQFCARFGVPYIKALGHREFARRAAEFDSAALLLIDSHEPGQLGGTGRQIEPERYPAGGRTPLLLAGGLNPANIGDIVTTRRPWGVDVSSGLESEPGVKDPRLIEQFFRQLQQADRNMGQIRQPRKPTKE